MSARTPRPPVYYGDRPFDPPSSDDEEEEGSVLLEKPTTPGAAERADSFPGMSLGEEDEELSYNGLFVGGERKKVYLRIPIHSLVTG